MRILRHSISIGCLCLSIAAAYAQPPNLEPDRPHFKVVPTVTFERVYLNSTSAHYSIAVDSFGNAACYSEELAPGARQEIPTGEPYILKFTISDATSMRIFQLAQQANYFKPSPSAANSAPSPGNKTLSYAEGPADSFGHWTNGVRSYVTYKDSTNPAIRQLTTIFEGIFNSIQLGRELEYFRRTSKTALDPILKRAEDRARAQYLIELQAITPSLKDVAEDPSVTPIVRRRAQHLLMLAHSSPAQ